MQMSSVGEQMSLLDLDTCYGKMFQEPRQAESTKAQISGASLKRQQGSSKKMPIYLDLRKTDGRTQDASWEMGILLPGRSMTHSIGAFRSEGNELLCLPTLMDIQPERYSLRLNIGEHPREANPSLLSEILVENADPKYNLSARACQGILNRANRRGKKLPEILQKALENQCEESDS